VDLLRWEEKTAQFLRFCIRRPHLQPFRTEAVFYSFEQRERCFHLRLCWSHKGGIKMKFPIIREKPLENTQAVPHKNNKSPKPTKTRLKTRIKPNNGSFIT
jgi:hypothetical protein